jgi:hypothetical protein
MVPFSAHQVFTVPQGRNPGDPRDLIYASDKLSSLKKRMGANKIGVAIPEIS